MIVKLRRNIADAFSSEIEFASRCGSITFLLTLA